MDLLEELVVKHEGTKSFASAAEILKAKVCNLATLQDLATRSIISNLARFPSEQFKMMPNGVKSHILSSVENVILSKSGMVAASLTKDVDGSLKIAREKNFEILSSIVMCLINSTLQEFNFVLCGEKNFFADEEGVDSKVLKQLAKKSTESLISIADRRGDYNSSDFESAKGNTIIHQLVKFTYLRHLDMATVRFSDDDLKMLSESCTLLKHLTLANFSAVTFKGLLSLRSLPHLESITVGKWFGLKDDVDCEKSAHLVNIFEMIPQLKQINQLEHSDQPDALSRLLFCLTIPPDSSDRDATPERRRPNRLVWRHKSADTYSSHAMDFKIQEGHRLAGGLKVALVPQKIYMLERLNTYLHHSSFHKVPSRMPNLKDVTLILMRQPHYNPSALPAQTLNQLPHLSVLRIVFPKWFNYSYLTIVGSKLTTLELFAYNKIQMDVFRMLLLCPNLSCLKIRSMVEDEFQISEVDMSTLMLGELHLENCLRGSGSIMWKLLMAPKLHTVCLEKMPFFDYPISLTTSSEPFLPNLINMKADFEIATDHALSQYLQLMEYVVNNCPKLSTFLCKCTRATEPRPSIILANISPLFANKSI